MGPCKLLELDSNDNFAWNTIMNILKLWSDCGFFTAANWQGGLNSQPLMLKSSASLTPSEKHGILFIIDKRSYEIL